MSSSSLLWCCCAAEFALCMPLPGRCCSVAKDPAAVSCSPRLSPAWPAHSTCPGSRLAGTTWHQVQEHAGPEMSAVPCCWETISHPELLCQRGWGEITTGAGDVFPCWGWEGSRMMSGLMCKCVAIKTVAHPSALRLRYSVSPSLLVCVSVSRPVWCLPVEMLHAENINVVCILCRLHPISITGPGMRGYPALPAVTVLLPATMAVVD